MNNTILIHLTFQPFTQSLQYILYIKYFYIFLSSQLFLCTNVRQSGVKIKSTGYRFLQIFSICDSCLFPKVSVSIRNFPIGFQRFFPNATIYLVPVLPISLDYIKYIVRHRYIFGREKENAYDIFVCIHIYIRYR